MHEGYDYESDLRAQKKIKLDTTKDREEALNARQSFVNLASSASLLLPPEMEAIVITRNNFTVEWDQPDLNQRIPPTKVAQVVQEEKIDEFKEEIHKNSFKLPFLFCNDSTPTERRDQAIKDNRNIIMTYVVDTQSSFSMNQLESIGSVNKKTIKETTEKRKLERYTKMINDVLECFETIDPRNVPIKDRKLVSIYCQAC